MKVFAVTETLIYLVLAATTWPAVESAFGDDMKREVFSEWSNYARTYVYTLTHYIHTACTLHIHSVENLQC